MMDQLDGKEDVFFIAHSLGSVHALHLAHHLGKRIAGALPCTGMRIRPMTLNAVALAASAG
jgi:predicted alpha/beta hydrolase family esterase